MTAPGLTVLVAARDEEERVADTVRALQETFPGAVVIVADDGSRDLTAARAAEAGGAVLRLPRRGKGQALTEGERVAAPGPLLLCDADLRGDLRPLLGAAADLAVARFARAEGGGFGLAKGAARALVRLRCGFRAREPLSGQRLLTPAARAACFPLAPGFGCEARMTIDAVRAGLSAREVELDLAHRVTGRDVRGFRHRGRQLLDLLLAAGPLAVNHRGLRLPLVGWAVALGGVRAPRRVAVAVAAVAAVGLADDLWSGPERGWRGHLAARRTTGVLKLVAIPAIGLAATRSLAGACLVGLAANALNQLDTRPGRALKAFLLLVLPRATSSGRRPRRRARAPAEGAYALVAVCLLPYDLRERMMLGDSGSNALGAVLALASVARSGGRVSGSALAALGGLNFLGERRSLGAMIEAAPLLSRLDRIGRPRP